MSTQNHVAKGTRNARRDARLAVAWPVAFEQTAELEQTLAPELARVYERVTADKSELGRRIRGTLRDLSVNGAFIEGEPLPLMSRVVMIVDVPGFRQVEAVGWVLWRRREACTAVGPGGAPLTLGPGFGMIFEWISFDARVEIARRVALLA
jgi:hypothetical protein